MATPHLASRVRDRRIEATGVIRLELEAIDGVLPSWTPGSHIDVLLPDGDARQYSLTADATVTDHWVLGILVEPEGRGGSRWIDENAAVGAELTLSVPRNHFEFEPGDRRLVFIAGGIGITALLPMIAQAHAEARDWTLHYIGRSLEHMGFREALAPYGDRVHLHPRDTSPRPDLSQIIGPGPVDVYCCGHESLIDDVEALATQSETMSAHVERFTPRSLEGVDRGADEFEVFFEYSGIEATVGPDQTILEVAEQAGIDVPTSCREGTCGTCETPLIEGQVVHLDSVLSDAERETSATLMICISRANCPRLVLDL